MKAPPKKVIHNRLTGESAEVKLTYTAAEAYLAKHPVEQLESDFDQDVWFKLDGMKQMIALVAGKESICEAVWIGPGWYRTKLVKKWRHNWLKLRWGGDPRRFFGSQLQRARKEWADLDG